MEVTTHPESTENTQNATDQLYSVLDSPGARQSLSQYLTEETDIDLSVHRIVRGSFFIDLKMKDYLELEEIKYLSDQGVLSIMLNFYLITKDFLQSCLAESVKLNVTVDIVSYQALLAFARGMLTSMDFPTDINMMF